MEKAHRQIESVSRKFLGLRSGCRTERRHRGPDVWTSQSKPQRARAAHRNTGKIYAIVIHWKSAFDVVHYVVHILLGDPLVAHTAPRIWTGNDKIYVLDFREISHVLGVRLAAQAG